MEASDAIQTTDTSDFGWSEVDIEPIVVILGIQTRSDFIAINITNPPTLVTLGGVRGFHSNFQPTDFGRSKVIS